ncbi:hypothetical protein SFR_3543 [Streptomyces sp. FR-008]|nr:hypothetical protein SFR_3543 [Streptomyces sp. FR-008]
MTSAGRPVVNTGQDRGHRCVDRRTCYRVMPA